MKMTLKNLTPSPDLSGLSAAELLAVIAGFQQQLALKEEAIQRRDAHILLLEELLRLRRIQRFAASSEKLPAFFKIVVAQSCFKQPLSAPARVSRAAPDLASRHR